MKILGINISARKFKAEFRTDPLNTVIEIIAASIMAFAVIALIIIFAKAAWQSQHPE